jgi:DNA polymerase III gamma/tau subunit
LIAKNLQLVGDVFLENFLHSLIARDVVQTLKDLDYLKEQGVDIKIFIEQSSYFLRDKLISSVGTHIFSKYLEIFECFHEIYGKLRSAPNFFMLFEVSILGFIHDKNIQPIAEIPAKKIESQPTKKEEPKSDHTSEVKKVEKEKIEDSHLRENDKNIDWSKFDFNVLVTNIKNTTGKSFVSMSLKSSEYRIEENSLIITPNNSFNRDKISTPEVIGFLGEEIEKLVGV